MRRLVVLGEYSQALEVYAELEAAGREDAFLRHQALAANLGANGYGPLFAGLIGRIWSTPPPALYREERFSQMPTRGWSEILRVTEDLAREDDEGLMRRTNAGARYAASLIVLRETLRRGEDPAPVLNSFREAVRFCAGMGPRGEGRLGLQQKSWRNAQRIEKEIASLNDEQLLEWLGARKDG